MSMRRATTASSSDKWLEWHTQGVAKTVGLLVGGNNDD